ncbi:MAG: M42 family metallopeptidase [Chloroflexi bacterium]|nr:M42 family metallopeptidase [Chloroflexota bacterium]
MSDPLPIDAAHLTHFLVGLLNTPSPTGFTERAMAYVAAELQKYPVAVRQTVKGGLAAEWAGASASAPRALTAHADTLGAMAKEIKSSGRLRMSRIGGFSWNTVEGEGVTVFTAAGRELRGSILLEKASSHIHGAEVGDLKRSDDNMEVRLDERVTCAEDTQALGVEVGDFIAFDPRVETGPAGYIRSRHLDDKAAVACVIAALKAMSEAGIRPAQRTTLHFSNYEEVGHGAASGFPPDIVELLAVDMAAVGEGQASDEFSADICVKDSGGPYHIEMRRKLVSLAQAAGIPYRLDIYPYYVSDGEAYWRAGGDVRVGLIGPGVDASHNYECTHIDSLVHTAQLIAQYLRAE